MKRLLRQDQRCLAFFQHFPEIFRNILFSLHNKQVIKTEQNTPVESYIFSLTNLMSAARNRATNPGPRR